VVSQSLLDGVPGAGFFSRVGETESKAVGQEEKVKGEAAGGARLLPHGGGDGAA
jgi:hypothetical protein